MSSSIRQLDVLCVGHAAFDVGMAVDHHPAADEKMRASALDLGGGGPAANAAICVARLGGRAGFCGHLGRDVFGEIHRRELQSAGVDLRFLVQDDASTPISQILAKPDGSRSVVNYQAAAPLAADAVEIPGDAARVFLFDGHEPEISQAIRARAAAARRVTVLDAGSVHAGTMQLAGNVDVLATSQTFARQWGKTEDMQEALEALSRLNACVIITLGERGLLWAKNGERGSLPAFAVEAVDTTGAGDAFHGALAYGLALDMAWPQLLRFASAAAALTCTRLGARRALPRLAAVQALLQQGTMP